MAYNSAKPVTGGSLVAADMRENFRALKEDDIVDGITRSVIAGTGLNGGGRLNADRTVNHTAHTGDVTGSTALTIAGTAVTQAKLKTTMASVSHTGLTAVNVTLPGGEYGFYPQIKRDAIHYSAGEWQIGKTPMTTSYVTNIYMGVWEVPNAGTAYAQQRYVTSSGEVFWIFILRDKITKDVVSMSQSPDHPCFGNGGKPLLMPHPFGDYDETKHEIIVINPSLAEIEQMELETVVDDLEYTLQNLLEDYVQDDTEFSFEYSEHNDDPEDDIISMSRKDIIALYAENKIDSNTKFWRSLPDKDLLEVITENYEIDEKSSPKWLSIPVTVGLPKHVKDKKGKKILADYRFMSPDTAVQPVKKVIPHPSYIKTRSLKRKP